MIPLTNRSSATTQKLQAFLSGAAATTNPTVTVASYIVPPQSKPDFSDYRSAPQFTVLAGATETDIADAPQQGSVKNIIGVSTVNVDTAAITLTICIDDNGTNRIQWKGTLAVGDCLNYSGIEENKWIVTDADGAVKTGVAIIPNSPLFLAYNSVNDLNVTGAGTTATIDFDTEVFDVTSNFASDTFTAPITGKYLLCTMVSVSGLTAAMTVQNLNLVTSNRTYRVSITEVPTANDARSLSITAICDMDAADTATVTLVISNGAGDTADITGSSTLLTYFSGVRVG